MTRDPAGEVGPRPLLTLGRVDRVRIQVGYRAGPDGPAQQQFLLDLAVPPAEETAERDVLDESRILTALEPVLYVGAAAPRHYSLHEHRWHTSWGPSPGTLDLGLLVTTGSRRSARSDDPLDGVLRAFRVLLVAAGSTQPTPTPREAAILRARQSVATAYALDPATMSLSAEEHHPAANSWTLGLRTTAGDEYDVVVGLVDGFAGSVRIRHEDHVEVFDAVGSE